MPMTNTSANSLTNGTGGHHRNDQHDWAKLGDAVCGEAPGDVAGDANGVSMSCDGLKIVVSLAGSFDKKGQCSCVFMSNQHSHAKEIKDTFAGDVGKSCQRTATTNQQTNQCKSHD